MSGLIYLIKDSGDLVEMKEEAYDSEDVLQGLLARYPNLLAGEQIDAAAPRRWLLISQEMGIPSEDEAGARWSVDHLFLDQDAIPTIVEVKRSSDTRIRREVVGQMLDYAANAVVYWPIENIIAAFEARCKLENIDSGNVLIEYLGTEIEPDQFWERAKTNLQAGKIRLVFVADEIPTELRRVVEFLNDQMKLTEVLAIEVRQYKGGELRTLVPRLVGTTKTDKTGVTRGEKWNESSFFSAFESRHGKVEAEIAKSILTWASEKADRITWGSGRIDGSYTVSINYQGKYYSLFSVWTNRYIQISFGQLAEIPPFGDEQKRLDLLRRLNEIKGASLPRDGITRYPSFDISTLKSKEYFEHFINTFEWVINEMGR